LPEKVLYSAVLPSAHVFFTYWSVNTL
jgi:hypothetical protein